MKKLTVLSVMLAFIAIAAFKPSAEIKYPSDLPVEIIEMLNGQLIKELSSSDLKADIESKFAVLIDKVEHITANHSSDFGYYYVIIGSKDGIEKIELLEVLKEDMENEKYPYKGITSSAGVWKEGNNFGPPVCPPGCAFYSDPSTCIGMNCIDD